MNPNKPAVQFVDRPCGSGKTTDMIHGLDATQSYVIVTPYLSEVDRIRTEALGRGVVLHEPEGVSKYEHFRQLIADGCSVVTTHKLFDMCKSVDLSGYHVIIDEIFDVIQQVFGPKAETWERVYVGDGYATVDADGLVSPTAKWDADPDGLSSALNKTMYDFAKRGRLYRSEQGFFVSAVPVSLFTSGDSCTVLTFLAEQSLMWMYLQHFGVECQLDVDPELERQFLQRFKQMVAINSIPTLESMEFKYGAQERHRSPAGRKVSGSLRGLRARQLKDVAIEDVFISCNRDNWLDSDDNAKGLYAKNSRMQKANFVARTTKGTNDFNHCTHGIYLNDLNLDPATRSFLSISTEQMNDWAVAEMFQWMYRGCIRTGNPMTLYAPSVRMRTLLSEFLEERLYGVQLMAAE